MELCIPNKITVKRALKSENGITRDSPAHWGVVKVIYNGHVAFKEEYKGRNHRKRIMNKYTEIFRYLDIYFEVSYYNKKQK